VGVFEKLAVFKLYYHSLPTHKGFVFAHKCVVLWLFGLKPYAARCHEDG